MSEKNTVRRFEYLAVPESSNEAAPVAGPIIVDKSEPLRRGFSAAPTREGSTPDFSLLNVLHSDPTSITLQNEMYSANVFSFSFFFFNEQY